MTRARDTLTHDGLPRGEYDGPDDDVSSLTLHQLRAQLRDARRRIDAHQLERATFLRHIERLEADQAGPRKPGPKRQQAVRA